MPTARTTTAAALAAAGLLALTGGPAAAHHAFSAEFDADKPLTLKGKVTKMQWINPHAWIHIEVTGEDGKVESWACEGGTPNTLLRRGFDKNSLLPGTEIVVDGYQAKQARKTGNPVPDYIVATG